MSTVQLSFVDKVRLQNAKAIILVRFQHKSGMDLFAYAKADTHAIEELQRKHAASEPIVISDYAEIIFFGEGEPNEATRQYIESLPL